MKLRSLRVENFRSIQTLDLAFPASNLLALVGPNNAGKSNIIRAIDAVCGDAWWGGDKVETHDHYRRDRSREISLTLQFDDGRQALWTSAPGHGKWAKWASQGRPLYGALPPKEAFPCIYLGADRSFERHTSFYDSSLLGRIRRVFHGRASPLAEELTRRYEDLVQVFDRVEGFRAFADGFSECFEQLQVDGAAKMSIDFRPYTPSNYFKSLQILTQDPEQPGTSLSLDELGEGTRNTALLALLWSYALHFRSAGGESPRGILALEEPELYLHPHARRHLFKVLRDIASSGLQVIISTHSSSFVDTEAFDCIARVRRVEDPDEPGQTRTEVTTVSKPQLAAYFRSTAGNPKVFEQPDALTEHYRVSANPTLNEGFFARFLVLVEGETEELALPVYLRQLGIECDRHGVSVLGVRGKTQIPKYWRLFSAFAVPMAVVFDGDFDSPTKARDNVDLARSLGLEVNEVDQFDRSIPWRAFSAGHGPPTPIVILNPNFEEAIRAEFDSWREADVFEENLMARFEQEARVATGSESKGLIARHVARRLATTAPAFIPGFVRAIGEAIQDALALHRGAEVMEPRGL